MAAPVRPRSRPRRWLGALALLCLSACVPFETQTDEEPPPERPLRGVSVSEDVGLDYQAMDNPIILFSRLDQELKRWRDASNRGEAHLIVMQERHLEDTARANFSQLVAALKTERAGFKQIAAMALGFSNDDRAVAPLVEALRDPDVSVRTNAALGLGQLRRFSTPARPLLTLLASDKDAGARSAAAHALAQIIRPGHDRGAMVPLVKATNDPDAAVRAHAALALGAAGSKFSVPTLMGRCLFDEDIGVRYNAALSLGAIGDRRAVAPLIEALKDRDGRVRQACAVALTQLTGQRHGDNARLWTLWAQDNLSKLQESDEDGPGAPELNPPPGGDGR